MRTGKLAKSSEKRNALQFNGCAPVFRSHDWPGIKVYLDDSQKDHAALHIQFQANMVGLWRDHSTVNHGHTVNIGRAAGCVIETRIRLAPILC